MNGHLHTISVLVEDRPGVLTRIAGLFAARGFNIDSLAVGATELINVIKILEHDQGSAVERELMLVKVRSEGDNRARIMEIADVFRVNVVDVTHGTLTLEASGKPEKLEALLGMLRDFGVVELSRTGRVALARGDRSIKDRTLKVANDG